MKRTILLTVIVICLLTGSSFADVPDLINFQGVLTDSTGTLLDGSFNITFRLYGQAVGGADFWTEAHLGIAVSSGSFSVKLGSMTSFLGLAPPGNAFWMGITVETDPEISPRTQLVSVPFAFMANEAVLADTALYAFKAGGIGRGSFGKNQKENFTEINSAELLEKISKLQITQWNYKEEDDSIKHIGPMAEDFYRLFGLGEDDKHINTLDPDGVALAAIKALYEKSKRVDALEQNNKELNDRLEKLEMMIDELSNK